MSDGSIIYGCCKGSFGELFYKSMKRILAHRRLFVASHVFVLVGMIALSSATRRPCLQACSGPWHTYKASHMTELEPAEMPVAQSSESTQIVVAETKTSRSRYIPDEEMLPVALPLTLQKHHFRSPPSLQ